MLPAEGRQHRGVSYLLVIEMSDVHELVLEFYSRIKLIEYSISKYRPILRDKWPS